MARSPTTLDSFAAIAEPRRRDVLAALIGGELPVNDIVETLGWPQPQVSKHLAVLREVGLVSVRRAGRERLYSVNGEQMKQIHDWVKTYEKFWDHQLMRIKQRAEAKAKGLAGRGGQG
jgi:DNA-binding transcriptional ArsR family regulator